MDIFLEFACELGALSADEAEFLAQRVVSALAHTSRQQLALQRQGEPTQRFLALLSAALRSGEAHILNLSGARPDDADTLWGWRRQFSAAGATASLDASLEWVPQGQCVGWLDGDDLYLDPEAAYAAAQRFGQQTGDPLAVPPGTLWKRLHERGWLMSSDSARETLKARVTIQGRRVSVIHLRASTLIGLSRDENPTNPTSSTTPDAGGG